MTVVGSRFGDNNQNKLEPGKGFTVICNDCGLFLSSKDFEASYCIACELIAVITCHGCKQETQLHTNIVCEREVNYVRSHEKPLGQLRDSEGGR
jgi:hypothetical protein